MFFKKKKKELELHQQPLNYWEEESFIIIPYKDDKLDKEDINNKLSNIKNFKLKGIAECSEDKFGRFVFDYDKVSYEINYIIDNFRMPEARDTQLDKFSADELLKIKECNKCLVLSMNFDTECLKNYKMQLLLGNFLLPNLICIIDESSENIIHYKQVAAIKKTTCLPSSSILYRIHVVADDDKIWLHTHGLSRCGLPELEIVESNKDNYLFHYNIIYTLADILISKGIDEDNKYFVGYVNENIPLIVTLKSWTEGLKEYPNIDLGGPVDRETEHNTNFNIIFTYESEDNMKNNICDKINIYDDMWDDEQLFLITSEETNRMKLMSQENFDYVRRSFEKGYKVLIKVGINISGDSYEHVWFELIELYDDKFKGKLISTPYNVDLKEGNIYTYKIDRITNWTIYSEDGEYDPNNAYELD